MNLLDKLKKEFVGSKKGVIFGNGLGISYLEHQDHKDHNSYFRLDEEQSKRIIKAFQEDIHKYLGGDTNIIIRSPSSIKERFEVKLNDFIIEHFEDNIDRSFKSEKLNELMDNFDAIFTINLDPIVYHNIFEKDFAHYRDGFSGDKAIGIKDIQYRLENSGDQKPLYYLHGAFHLMKDVHKNTYSKVIKGSNASLYDGMKIKYRSLLDNWDNKTLNYEAPLMIMSSNWFVKKDLMYKERYFKLCFDKLSELEYLFIMGCSFRDDHHILEWLIDNGGKLKKILVGCNNKDVDNEFGVKKNIKEALILIETLTPDKKDKIQMFNQKISYEDTTNFSSEIWGD